MSQGIRCHNCGSPIQGGELGKNTYSMVEVLKVNFTGYYEERTEWERTVFCSMPCLKSYHFGTVGEEEQ